MNILDALSCPYCGAPLLKESYYFRCGFDHRFAFAFQPRGEAPAAPRLGEPGGAGDGAAPARSAGAGAGSAADGGTALLVRVLSHPDRTEVGRVYAYPFGEEEP